MGRFAGGSATGGTNPNTSSMYIIALRSPVPCWARIQVTSAESRRVTMNCRSSSDRWAR